MSAPTVLVSGAGIAGPALAFWLTRNGYRVVVVETAADIRPGGQTVDLRGAGADVVARMGLLEQMERRALFQRGIAWVRSDGSRRAEMPVTAFDGNGPVSKLEILRGDLVDVLYGATKDVCEYRFGTRIETLAEHDAGVDVTFADGGEMRADLVVGADGPHSAVRRLVFGPEERFVTPLGGYNAWFSAPDTVGLDGWYLMFQAPGGLNASMRPSHDPSTVKASLSFRSEPIVYDRRDLGEQRKILRERFTGVGWQCDALIEAAERAEDFYFDSFTQVKMVTWSSDRVTLVGDAGYCASPLSGMGTSLALVGGYLLARELGSAGTDLTVDRLRSAFRRYDVEMRPYVDRCQKLNNTLDRYAPMTEKEISDNATAMKWMQRWPLRPIASRLWFRTADAITLPD
ncbi:FAD-dependent monooxygenase [Mycolicibacterium monacense]|uniref:Monooxygenase n=1 Tax=Mycolicibacterium monacense TaxID=85693 RepID=A0AAD1MX36_MYCMB|nr:FAD-dependent monooxygenase [Mycolicibacterium monacense]MDA4105139.1 FAD-binding monooxygenase [Mycolicibacterium monacense DSM 44395]ORB19565.1 FAD-binding monooxygenase [Mycolicibacterium monacense DSM 44395]QHP86041.1 FAD-binding monooxygenase [Mycolicibacterium monacense DSM 44395]BBZ61013.1 monooxygenase [Mycolicibacterium monacense]